MAKESKTILELDDKLIPQADDRIPAARPGREVDSYIKVSDLISFNQSERKLLILGRYNLDVSSLLSYTLLVQPNDVAKGGVSCEVNGVASNDVKIGDNVKLTASATENYKFSHWEDGEGNTIQDAGVNYTFEFNSNSPSEYHAIFVVKEDVTLTVIFTNGQVECNGEPLTSGEGVKIKEGSPVQLIATADTGYKISNWTDIEDNQLKGEDTEYTFVINSGTTIKCNFVRNSITLTTGVVGNKGGSSIITDNNGNEIEEVDYGGTASFIATPNTGGKWGFDGWYSNIQGSGQSVGDEAIKEVNNILVDTSYFAKFKRVGDYDYYIGFISDKNSDSFPSVQYTDLVDSTKVLSLYNNYIDNLSTIKNGYQGNGATPLGYGVFYVLYESTLNEPDLYFKGELDSIEQKYDDGLIATSLGIQETFTINQTTYKICWVEFENFGSREYLKVTFN